MSDLPECRYEHRLSRGEARLHEHDEKFIETERRLNVLEQFSARYDEKYTKIIEILNDLKAKVEILSSRPAESWNLVIKTGITAVVSGLIGAGLTLILK